MRLSRQAALLLTAAWAAGCASKAAPPRSPTEAGTENAARFARDEDALLGDLAAVDARLARRTGVVAKESDVRKNVMGAILAEDSTLEVGDEGALDLFSFEARARGLEAASQRARGWTYPLAKDVELERRLLVRLIDEEKARVAEEKALPRSASELVRGVVACWVPPSSQEAGKERDKWLARRLTDVLASLRDGALTKFEANELDDSLDALERLTAGYGESSVAMARLRVALDQVKPASDPTHDGESVRRGVRTHLGLATDAAMFARMERAEKELRKAISASNAGRSEAEMRTIESDALARVLVEDRCHGNGSRLRSRTPPPERAYVCGSLRRMADATSPHARTAALMALHTELVVALWTSPIHFGQDAPYRAANKLRPLMPIPPEREVRLLRVAAVRPVAALAVGWAAVLLTEPGPDADAATNRARRWLSFGDAPFDIVEGAGLWTETESSNAKHK
ncbi:hypothetical protein LVJ94_46145 [Pendulispora rubella]|uniref:Uncharacterized protein n=1 Tax=Pendulispora rubella TaxID=2741070 RepID=A0ABZ2L3Y2_9BACT